MNTNGNFRISREIFHTNLFKNIIDFRLFFLIHSQAMFKDGVKAGAHILEKGEWLRSYRQLQNDLEFIDGRALRKPGIATIKRSIERLTAEHLIETKIVDSGTVFKILETAPALEPAPIAEQIAERIAEHHHGTKRNKEVLRNKEKEEINNIRLQPRARVEENYFDCYYLRMGKQLNPYQIQSLSTYIDQDGIETSAVCLAIEKTAQAGAGFPYLEKILNNWLARGITTAEKAAAAEMERRLEHKAQTQEKTSYTQKGRIETRPRIQTDYNPSW